MLNLYKGKKVLVTGHTGFKGSWLTLWLLKLGAKVTGFSDEIPTQPSLFEDARLDSKITHILGDIRDFDHIHRVIDELRPDFIFHLAAQAIVSTSYLDPHKTMSTNFIGTINVMESIRLTNHNCSVVIVTSDKCYENVEWIWGYKETDQLGGKDIYSSSKGAAEIAFHGYFNSFFNKPNSNIKIATGRAGNVIGGGDWAKDRLVVDCIKNWSNGQSVEIRSPDATRPWQHVLEPLSGYLTLGMSLTKNKSLSGESFNFGPLSEKSHTVVDLILKLSSCIGLPKKKPPYMVVNQIPFNEAGLLRLNCDKALFKMNWEASLTYNECVNFVSNWYVAYLETPKKMYEFSLSQISEYENIASEKGSVWAKN